MSTEEIIKRAVEKAEKNGYRGWGTEITDFGFLKQSDVIFLIFSLEFAKAFWGEDEVDSSGATRDEDAALKAKLKRDYPDREYNFAEWYPHSIAWQYHLQEMVLMPNPPGYLERFIK